MADVFTKSKRSEVMSRIRSRGNRDTELALARLLRAHRITGWSRHIQIRTSPRPSPQRGEGVRVKPDFVFRKLKLAIFVDGCFWHGCPQHAMWPANRAAWWRRKLEWNRKRDRLVTRTLRRAGWRVLRVWEHTLQWATRSQKRQARLVRRIQRAFNP